MKIAEVVKFDYLKYFILNKDIKLRELVMKSIIENK